jgi:uncharacterized protein (TIGR02466 family)
MLITFPTVIYKTNIKFDDVSSNALNDAVTELNENTDQGTNPWISTTKNTMGIVEPHKQEIFSIINNEIDVHLSRFCKELRVHESVKFKATQSWINFYSKDDYQESHYHPNFVFSAVFYYKVTENTKIIFENPAMDMTPLEVDCQTDLNRQYLTINPKDGDLIIFRSYLRHQVPRHGSNDTKITFAYNFEKEA